MTLEKIKLIFTKAFKFLFITLLFGCELVVDVDVPYEKGLTLNSFFTPDSTFMVQLAVNRFVLDENDFQKIENGVVKIYEDDQLIETLMHVGNGVYKSPNRKPIEGKRYKVIAETKNLGAVTGQFFLPSAVKIFSIECDHQPNYFSTKPHELFTASIKIKLKIDDPANSQDYYEIFLQTRKTIWNPQTQQEDIIWSPAVVDAYDASSQNHISENGSLLINDILFNGKTGEIDFKTIYRYNFVSLSNPAPYLLPPLKITLRTVSSDYYKYLSTSQLQDKITGDPFAQPVNVHSNIENGFGIFAGYSETIVEYIWPLQVIDGFSSMNGRAGDHIIINGRNFHLYDYFNIAFNGFPQLIPAQILSRSENQIEVVVPQGASTGPISTFSNGGKVVSSLNFEVLP
jgi:hypothetical protein